MGYLINQTVDLMQPGSVEMNAGNIAFYGDKGAHTWRVEVKNSAGFLKNKTATVYYKLQSGETDSASATIDGDVITVDMSNNAYSEVGVVRAFMKVSNAAATETVTVAVLRFIVSDCAVM